MVPLVLPTNVKVINCPHLNLNEFYFHSNTACGISKLIYSQISIAILYGIIMASYNSYSHRMQLYEKILNYFDDIAAPKIMIKTELE